MVQPEDSLRIGLANSGAARVGSRRCRRAGWRGIGAAVIVATLCAVSSRAAELSFPSIRVVDAEIVVSLRLDDAFTSEALERLDSGLQLSFEYVVQARERRRRFFDRTASERYVVVTAEYSSLTRMYRLARRVDGAVVANELTDDVGQVKDWMMNQADLPLFDQRDLGDAGAFYLRAKVRLQRRFRLLFLRADEETDWTQSAEFDWEPPR